jgi:hypothetical protein
MFEFAIREKEFSEPMKSARKVGRTDVMLFENSQTPSSSSPFLNAFLKTDRVWDDASMKEWADDVERRLREVRSQIDPGPLVLGYSIGRRGNVVVVSTVSRNELNKREIAALSQGQWPCWDEIVKAVPEFTDSKTGFDACTSFEWWRKWDVEDEMRRFRVEDGMFT